MRPAQGAEKQIEIYREMTGKQRLRIVFELWELALSQAIMSEKRLHPYLSQQDIEQRALKRLNHESN